MSLAAHREAEYLMSQGDIAIRLGQFEEAQSFYRAAAEAERAAFALIPFSRPRTRGLLAISEVSLLQASTDFTEAERRAHEILAQGDLPDFAHDELLDLALRIRHSRHAESNGWRLSPEALIVALKGGGVRVGGFAPLYLIHSKIQQMQNYIIRVAEMVAGSAFRSRGGPPPELTQAFTPMIGPSMPGSYSFSVSVESPAQLTLPLFATSDPDPSEITMKSFSILSALGSADLELFESEVEDERYQGVFLRMVRNLAPTGQEISEIEVSRKQDFDSVSLRSSSRSPLNKRIHATRSVRSRETQYEGVLRALDLDREWVILVENGKDVRLNMDPNKVFDDVVGPMVNCRVRVLGHLRRGLFYATDIVEVEDSEIEEQDFDEQTTEGFPRLFSLSG